MYVIAKLIENKSFCCSLLEVTKLNCKPPKHPVDTKLGVFSSEHLITEDFYGMEGKELCIIDEIFAMKDNKYKIKIDDDLIRQNGRFIIWSSMVIGDLGEVRPIGEYLKE